MHDSAGGMRENQGDVVPEDLYETGVREFRDRRQRQEAGKQGGDDEQSDQGYRRQPLRSSS